MSLKITPTDNTKEKEGTWTKYLEVDLKIARSTKPDYVSEIARRMKVFRGNAKKQVDAIDVIDETCKALAAHILVDWKNFVINGEAVEYSKDNAYELLRNDPDCREFVVDFADDLANFYKEETEEIVGKSMTE